MIASVIIPTYQRAAYLIETLNSLISQKFPKDQYELIIVDNSIRPTPELSSLHKPESSPAIQYINEPNNGLHNARHAGARAARGEILVFLDDDVLIPPGWLAAIIDPFKENNISVVAGRIVLHFEITPPRWLQQFHPILGETSYGLTPRRLVPYQTPFGGNMAIRKSDLFAIGGFNPDGFGDRRLIHLRGDGENGLARKVHDAGLLIWYAPEAWLYHRVPAKRMTPEYVQRRSALAGIEVAYTELRYHRRTIPQLMVRSAGSFLKYIYHRLHAGLHRGECQQRLSHLAAASHHRHRGCQHLRQVLSRDLRLHTFQESYLA